MRQTVKVKELIFGEGMPKVCIPITGSTKEEVMAQVEALDGIFYDLVEWRVDFYEKCSEPHRVIDVLREIRSGVQKPILVTFRTRMEGGENWFGIEEYERLYETVIETKLADLIDLELFLEESIVQGLCLQAHRKDIKVVMSNHDFDKTPEKEEMIKRLVRMHQLGADLPKLAVMPKTEQDVLTLMMATRECVDRKKVSPVITMSMGSLGKISRITGSFFGSAMTFATNGTASAPGQIEVGKLLRLMEEVATD